MGSIFIQNFKFGMDRRRMRVAGVPGTLWLGKNVQISRGGDIERVKSFALAHTLPTSITFGLTSVRGQLYVFGSAATPTMPAGVQYQRLQSPDSTAMVRILDVRSVDGKLYAIARFASGHVYHFYNGTRVSEWDALADAAATYSTLADYMAADLINADADVTAIPSAGTIAITAKVPGTAFTLTASTVTGGGPDDQVADIDLVIANVVAVAEVRATGSVTITGGTAGTLSTVSSVTVNAVEMLAAAVQWVGSNSATASSVAAQINNRTGTHGYSAVAVSNVVTINAPIGLGAAANGRVVAVTTGGDVTASSSNTIGGVTAVDAVAQVSRVSFGGTFHALDKFTITINNRDYVGTGRASATGGSSFVHKKRVWSPANSLWRYSKLNDPTNWTDPNVNVGAGFINVSSDSEGTERLVGATAYGTQAAVYSRRQIWLYNLSTDAVDIVFAQPIENSGVVSARTPLGYGNLDVFYLDESGVRSLRAKENQDSAFADDIGAPIDPFLRDYMDAVTDDQIQRSVTTIEPRDRRFWLALADRIFILSYFPKSGIAAWTFCEPGFAVSDFSVANRKVYARSGDFVYAYGGVDGTEYPNAGELTPDVQTPFAAAQIPTFFNISGFDVSAYGSWTVHLLVDPDNENASVSVGTCTGCTFPDAEIAVPGRTTHVAVNLTGVGAGPLQIANLAIRHDGKEPNA